MCAIAALGLIPATSRAVDFTWNGLGGNVNWGTAANWGGAAPTSATTTNLIFAGTTNLGTLAAPLNQNIGNPMTLNSLAFNSGGGAFFLGGSPLTFTTGASNSITQSSSSAQNIANDITATDNSTVTLTLAGNGAGVVTMSGIISKGNGAKDYAIVKSGSSTFALTGVNTYTGGTTINGGTLSINNASSLGTGALSLNAGTLEVSTGFTSSRSITLGSAASTFQIDPSQTYTLTSAIGGSGALNKTGTGTMVLSGTTANTYSGATLVNDGTLQLNKMSGTNAFAGALTVGDGGGSASSAVTQWLASTQAPTTTAVTVNSDGWLDLNNFSQTIGGLTMTGGRVTTGTGVLTLGGTVTGNAAATSATISGKLGLGANRTFTIADGAATVDMDISAVVSGAFTLTKTGAGTMVLSGANTYTGTTTVSGGTLKLGLNNAVPTASSVVVSSGGTLDNGGFTLGGNGVSSLSVQNGGTLRLGGSTAFPTNYSAVTLGASSTVEYAGTSAQTVALQNYGNLTINNPSGVTLAALAGPVTINGNLYLQAGLFSRNDGSFGTPVTIKGDITADAGTTLGGEIAAFTFAGTAQNITLSGVTSSQDLGQMIIGTTTSNPTVTLQTNVDSSWGLTVGTAAASTGTLNLNGHTLSVGAGNVTVNIGGTFLNTTGLLNINGIFGIGTWTDNTGTQNFGAVSVSIPGTTVSLGSNVRSTLVTVNGGTFSLGTFNLTTTSLIMAAGAMNGGTVSASSAFDVRSGTIGSVLIGAGALTKTTSGTVTVSSANTYTGNTTISAGTLTLSASGSLTGTDITVGTGATLNINGSINTGGSKFFTLEGTLGSPATATLNSGGSLSTAHTFVGSSGGGTFTQSGGTHTPTFDLYLGYNSGGSGTYNLSAGSLSTGRWTFVGDSGSGVFNLSGSGLLSSTSHTFVGFNSSGTFTQSGGTNTVGDTLYLGFNSGGSGIYNLNGGTLTTTTVAGGGGTGTFNFNGGTLKASLDNTTSMSGLTAANVKSGGALIDSNGHNITIGQALVHDAGGPAIDGGLTKSGSGTLTLTGANTYSGTTTIGGGTLTAAASSGSALGSTSSITVNSGGTLMLGASGQINNTATMTLAGGTFALAGNSEGAGGTTGVGTLTLTATSTIDFAVGASSSIVQFAGLGTHTAGTILQGTNWDGTPVAGGGAERLLFSGLATDFTSLYGQSDVMFNGVAGYVTVQFGGYYEITSIAAVPEPSTWVAGALAFGALVFAQRRRLAKRRA